MEKRTIKDIVENIHVTDGIDYAAIRDFVGPCATIYLPMVRRERNEGHKTDWDRIEFKDLAKQALADLALAFPDDTHAYQGVSERLEYLQEHQDEGFWQDKGKDKALALFITNEDIYAMELDFDVEAIGFGGNYFDTVPLQFEEASDMHYHLLLLGTDHFGWIDGDSNKLHYVELPDDVKAYFAELFADYDGENTALDYHTLEGHMSPYHDHLSRHEVSAEEAKKFFRYVNKAVSDKLALHDPTPIILVSAVKHQHQFREVSTLHQLLPKGIAKDPNGLTGDELIADALEVMAECGVKPGNK